MQKLCRGQNGIVRSHPKHPFTTNKTHLKGPFLMGFSFFFNFKKEQLK